MCLWLLLLRRKEHFDGFPFFRHTHGRAQTWEYFCWRLLRQPRVLCGQWKSHWSSRMENEIRRVLVHLRCCNILGKVSQTKSTKSDGGPERLALQACFWASQPPGATLWRSTSPLWPVRALTSTRERGTKILLMVLFRSFYWYVWRNYVCLKDYVWLFLDIALAQVVQMSRWANPQNKALLCASSWVPMATLSMANSWRPCCSSATMAQSSVVFSLGIVFCLAKHT